MDLPPRSGNPATGSSGASVSSTAGSTGSAAGGSVVGASVAGGAQEAKIKTTMISRENIQVDFFISLSLCNSVLWKQAVIAFGISYLVYQ